MWGYKQTNFLHNGGAPPMIAMVTEYAIASLKFWPYPIGIVWLRA